MVRKDRFIIRRYFKNAPIAIEQTQALAKRILNASVPVSTKNQLQG